MNTRSDTIGTVPPSSTRHTPALPTAANHQHCNDDTAPRTRGRKSHTGHSQMRRRHDNPGITWSREPLTMDVQSAAARPAVNRDDPRQADLAQEDSLVPPNNARPRNTLHQRLSVTARLMQRTPDECGLPLAALRLMMSNTDTDPTNLPNLNKFLPHPPHSSTSKKRTGPDTDLSIALTFLSHKPGTQQTPPRGQPNTRDPQARQSPQECYQEVVKNVTFQGEGQAICAPLELTRTSSEKVKRQGTRSRDSHNGAAGAASAHVTCDNGARDTLPAAQNANSVKERERGVDTDQHSFLLLTPDRNTHGAIKPTARDPQARRPLLANTEVLRRAQPAAPDRTPRHQSTSQATVTSRNCTETQHRHHRTSKTQHDTAHDGPANTSTTEQAQHPWAPMGSTGMLRGGPKGPCHRRGCTYDRRKRS